LKAAFFTRRLSFPAPGFSCHGGSNDSRPGLVCRASFQGAVVGPGRRDGDGSEGCETPRAT
jgi:hypothetical protein